MSVAAALDGAQTLSRRLAEWERRAGGTGDRRHRLRHYLDGLLGNPGTLLIGAAVGAGMTAEAAERGGADFLIALSAGRLRVMGAPSIACLLPLSDSNALVVEVARREILPRAGVPVFFGASTFDPAVSIDRLVEEVAGSGFAGVVNFPTAAHLDGPFRAWLEAEGLGFAREVKLMRTARAAGLGTLAYCRSLDELDAMAAAGIDLLCVNFGWNKGGIRGVSEGPSLEQASATARQLVARLRALSPDSVCLLEGGPIVGPRDLHEACRQSRAQGYIGGSTIDRLPLESSVADVTSAFKAVESLSASPASPRGRIDGMLSDLSLQGPSAAADRLRVQVRKLAVGYQPALIIAEEGAEELRLAATLAGFRRAGTAPAQRLSLASEADPQAALFGRVGDGNRRQMGLLEAVDGTSLVIEHLQDAEGPLQAALRTLLESGGFHRPDDGRWMKTSCRLVFTARPALRERILQGRFDRDLYALLASGFIELPPLRERLEDLPHLCRILLAELRRGVDPQLLDLEQQAFRPLMAHDWPGNLRELRQVLARAALAAGGRTITAADVTAALGEGGAPTTRSAPEDERRWLLDGLARNRFRRGDTAVYLGISRKTLYNKMRHYRLLADGDGGSSTT